MMFHPFEIGFSGFSNTGKTTLITRLIENLKTSYRIGYIKHASCGFSIDAPGKDSELVYRSGAGAVHLVDSEHSATIKRGKSSLFSDKTALLENDFVFIEGYKDLLHEKIVFLDPEKKILDRVKNVIATVGEGGDFNRDDHSGISSFIVNRFHEQAKKIPLYGLVLGGGFSKRMGRDKAMIDYSGKIQAAVCYDLLSALCDRVYISRREEQEPIHLPVLYDEFRNMGPLGGILTAMKTHRDAAWLVLACDYPFMDESTLQILAERRNPFKFATAFEGTDALPEPLCTIYEPKSYTILLQSLALGLNCPRKALIQCPISLSPCPSSKALCNVNEPLAIACSP